MNPTTPNNAEDIPNICFNQMVKLTKKSSSPLSSALNSPGRVPSPTYSSARSFFSEELDIDFINGGD